jgi:hypothetical protein
VKEHSRRFVLIEIQISVNILSTTFHAAFRLGTEKKKNYAKSLCSPITPSTELNHGGEKESEAEAPRGARMSSLSINFYHHTRRARCATETGRKVL